MAKKMSASARQRRAESLRRQQNAKRSEQNALNAQIRANNQKIERLQTAYNRIEDIKKSANACKNADENNLKFSTNWKGNRWHSFEDGREQQIHEENSRYISAIDEVHDAINDEIARLAGEHASKQGVIQRLGAGIYSLGLEIKNLFN